MSAEPKSEALAEIIDRLLPPGGLARTAARHSLMKELAGWVSPEEAKAREAAARREALLPFAKLADNLDKAAEWNELSVRERKERWPEDLAHGVSRPSASLRARTLLRAALAEPERDEEGTDV